MVSEAREYKGLEPQGEEEKLPRWPVGGPGLISIYQVPS
jgi:hypothetical protein